MKKIYWILGLIILIIDQLLKQLVIDKNIEIIPNFINITYTKNAGAAFGFGKTYIILIVSIVLIIGIIIFLIKNHKNINSYIPYILILSGSIGNLIDRVFRGYVIDFIDIKLFNFPHFNIADISIVIGVFYLIILIIKEDKKNNDKKKKL